MKRRLALLAAAWLALVLAAPGAAAAFLWEIASSGNRVYLFGTVHAGKAEWYPLPAAVESAFVASPVLVVEADIGDAAGLARTAPAMVLEPPQTLASAVPPGDYARFRKLLGRYGLREGDAQRLKPFMAASMLVFAEWARLGYLPQHGVDAYLLARARAAGKTVLEIEGLDEQARLIASLGPDESRTIFAGTLDALESGLTAEQIRGMVDAWREGEPERLLEIARRYNERVPGARAIEEKFIWSRHGAMADKIEGYLNGATEPHFVAVGSLHLAGPRGLVEILRRRGYTVRAL